ncbi:hypothetical protein Asp14428_18460 [Actinoplanes sp. NBRC 14428]|nr:hypothetical protein Asp14428_18460 [Actinoplanes sp. NBRC 14428]
MIRIRVISSIFIGVSAMAVAACGGGDEGATATFQPPPSAPAPTSAAAGKPAGSDKELCEAVDQADVVLTGRMVRAMQGGKGPSAADIKDGLLEFAQKLSAASAGGDSAVARAMRKTAAESTEVAQAPDPATAGADPAYEKTTTDLEAACRAAGVKVKL